MKAIKPVLLSFSLLAFAGVHAQDATKQQQPQPQQQQQQQQAQPAQEQQQTAGEISLRDFDGMNIVDRHGKEIGDVDDVVIDLNAGRIHAVVVGGQGGFLGIGGENYAFAPEEFQRDQQNRLVLDVDQQKLEKREGFAQAQWPGLDDDYWGRVQEGAAAGGTAQKGEQQKMKPGEMSLMRGNDFLGQDVQDKQGHQLGEIRDAMMNLQDGSITSLVVNLKDVGDVRVPAEGMARGTDDRIVLDVDREQLMAQARQQDQQQRQQQEAQPQRQQQEAQPAQVPAGPQEPQQKPRAQ
jgi:sporulation protein YlmC with PRC-barrel domain